MDIENELKLMLREDKKFNTRLYSAGEYWRDKTKKIVKQMRRKTLAGFRGYDSGVGTSYCDNVVTDNRNEVYGGFRGLVYQLFNFLPFFSRVVSSHVALAKGYHQEQLVLKNILYAKDPIVRSLLARYKIENSTSFGCIDKVTIDGRDYSCLYLELLNTHGFISVFVDFSRVRTMLEIGGGFGANVHILLQNHPNICKVFYLDIVPNLIVGTEYLKSLYGKSVVEFVPRSPEEKIQFKDNDDIEIVCIAPWQIEALDSAIDYFHNANSFVEMPVEVVRNYGSFIAKLLRPSGRVALVSYDRHDPATTFAPELLSELFGCNLNREEYPVILGGRRRIYFFN